MSVAGDAKQKNFLRNQNGDWRITDFDATALIGKPTCFKYSEAYIPPEYMVELLPQREMLGPQITEGHATIIAHPSFDMWELGTVLFELFTGASLFAKDVNDDCCVHLSDCEKLASWVELSLEQLNTVFPTCDSTTRLLAQDLLALLLTGEPSHRPSSMDQVLNHPFFRCASGAPICLPIVPRHSGAVDCIFSYQSRDVALLRRLRRCFALLGVSTVDGSQVPPGRQRHAICNWLLTVLLQATIGT